MKKRILSLLMCIAMILTVVYNPVLAEKASATCALGIKGNGTNGIYIDINSAPFTTFANYGYGGYGEYTCTWFAAARANQLTGIGNTIWTGQNWYDNYYNTFGYGRGSVPREKALACFTGHVAVVEKVNGNMITISEGGARDGLSDANHGYCVIREVSRDSLENSSFLGYVYLTSGIENPIGTPTIQKSQFWYDIKDTIHVAVNAANATNYYVAVFKDDQKVYEGHCPNGDLKFAANTYGQGSYGIYFSCYNSKYSKDSEWVNFSVVGPASYTDVSSSKANYAIDENVTIKVSTVCAKGQVIGIERKKADGSWERVVTQDVPSEYTFKASALGKGTYSAYFSVYNGSGVVDTTRVNFTIEIDNAQGTVCQHKWNDGSITTQPTCTTTGVRTYACQSCGEKKTETIAKKAHTEVVLPGKAATTTEAGLTAGKKCSVCQTVTVKQEVIAKLPPVSVTPTPTPDPTPTPTPEKATIGKVKLSIASYVYNGRIKSPKVIVKDSKGNILKKNVAYTVTTPKGRKAIGKYTYTIKFKGDFAGAKAKKLTLTIKPKTPTITAPKAAKKAVTVKWKKGKKAQVTGYQVMVATNSKCTKNAKTLNVKGYKVTSKKVTKLKAKTKYFVKVRTYKTVKGVKINSNWSKVKIIRTK